VRNAGLTLIETLVVLALLSLLTVIFVSQMPRAQAVNPEQVASRLGAALEAAHTQAVAERTALTLTGDGERLLVTAPDGTEEERFGQTSLTGSLTIQPDGQVAGGLTLTTGAGCTQHGLSASGIASQAACGGTPVAVTPAPGASVPSPTPAPTPGESDPTPPRWDPIAPPITDPLPPPGLPEQPVWE
jgi:prepilin-type N-terminal cleavage/methylation domain-containing protein